MVLNKFGKYEPDFNSRYFIEDFPFGLMTIYKLAKMNRINCPKIEMVILGNEKCWYSL